MNIKTAEELALVESNLWYMSGWLSSLASKTVGEHCKSDDPGKSAYSRITEAKIEVDNALSLIRKIVR